MHSSCIGYFGGVFVYYLFVHAYPTFSVSSIMYLSDQDVVIGYTAGVSRCRRVASRERTRLCRVSVTLKADHPACQPVRATSPRRQSVTLCVFSPDRCWLQGSRLRLPEETLDFFFECVLLLFFPFYVRFFLFPVFLLVFAHFHFVSFLFYYF